MRTMQTRILFATDGRAPAKHAGELLRRLADPGRVTLTILHADEYGNREVADRYAQMVLEEAQQEMHDAGITAVTARADGDAAVAVEKELTHDDYGLILVGAGNH